MNRFLPWAMLLAIGAAPGAAGQSLSLFLPADGQDPGARIPEPLAAGPLQAMPGFTLRSSSRFGDSYRSVLVDGAGNSIDVRWTPGETVTVPQHEGYRVLEVSAQTLLLQFPPGIACQETGAEGFHCNDDGTALLSLVALAPLQRNAVLPMQTEFGEIAGPQQATLEPAATAEGFVNPFINIAGEEQGLSEAEIADRAQRARVRAERLQQFQPERIPEDQVPPGMRVVRTPFGDRLVPIRE